MKKNRRDGAEALRRVILRAMQDVPHVDDDAGRWENSRAEAYATSVVRRGLIKGVRERGNGAAARRNLVPRYRARLEHVRDMTAQLHDIRGDESAVEFLDRTRDWADALNDSSFEALATGITIAACDHELFDLVSVQGVSPEAGETERHVVIDAWSDGDEINAIVHAMANAVYGVQGVVMDRDGALTAHPVNDLLRSRPEADEIIRRIYAMIVDGAVQNVRYSARRPRETVQTFVQGDLAIGLPDRAAVDTSTWEALSTPIERVPLSAGEEIGLLKRTDANAVLRALMAAIAPVMVDGAEAAPDHVYLPESGSLTPFQCLAIVRATESALIDQTLTEIKGNARIMISEARARGDDKADLARMEAAAATLGQPETLPAIAMETIAEHYGPIEPVYSSAARFAARIARAQNAGMSVDVSAHGEIHGDDEPTIAPSVPHHGIIVVRDSALAEAATDSQIVGAMRRPDHPLVVMFAADASGAQAIVLQLANGAPTLCGWRSIAAKPDKEDDLSWYLRKAIGSSIARRDGATIEVRAPAPTAAAAPERPVVTEVEGLKLANHPHPDRSMRKDADRTGLRPNCQVKLAIEDPALAIRIVDAWFSQQSVDLGKRVVLDQRDARRGWRLEHLDETGRYLWAVSARIQRDERTTISIVVETNKPAIGARLPRLVRLLAGAMRVDGPDGQIVPAAGRISGNAQMLEFRRLATDPGRDLPILLISDRNGETVVDPDAFAGRAAGVMHVFQIGKTRSFDLSDTWGRDLSAYLGAARLYRPGFNPASDTSQQHPLIFAGGDAEAKLNALLSRETSETLHRYQVDTGEGLTDEIEDAIRNAGRDPGEDDDVPEAVEAADVVEAVAPAPEAEDEVAEPEMEIGPPVTEAAEHIEATPDHGDGDGDGDVVTAADASEEGAVADLLSDHGEDEANEDGEGAFGGIDFGGVPFEEGRARRPRMPRAPKVAPAPDADALEEAVRRAIAPLAERLSAFEGRFDGLERDLELSGRRAEAVQAVATEREAASQERLLAERRENNELITIAETERDEAYAEVERLRRTIATLEAELSAYKAGRTPVEATRPVKLDAIPDWVDQRFGGRVTIMPRCQRALRKAEHSDIPRLLDAIELLAGPYVDMKRGDGTAREAWLKGLEALRMEDTPHQTWGGPSAAEYQITYRNKTLQLDKHIKGRESTKRDDHMIRIYYTWHEETGEVLIGHMPGHLSMRGR